jgi:phosphatidylserine decarboxylase
VKIAPEGRPFIVAGFAVLAVLLAFGIGLGGWAIAPAAAWALVALWVPWFFRVPEPDGPRDPQLILAPANGRVVSVVETAEPEYLGGPARRISIFMNVFDVHVNRHPMDGVVEYRRYRPGLFLNATLDKASENNEQLTLGVRGERGRVTVKQIAGLIARRIVCDAEVGERVRQADRLGLIRFGSRVDTFVPLETAVRVAVGTRTTAGVTVLGEWPGGARHG